MHTSLDGFVGGPNGEMDWIDESGGERTLVAVMLSTIVVRSEAP